MALGELGRLRKPQSLVHDIAIVRIDWPKPPLMGKPRNHNKLLHPHIPIRGVPGGGEGHQPRLIPTGKIRDGVPLNGYAAPERRDKTRNSTEQGGFSASVAPKERNGTPGTGAHSTLPQGKDRLPIAHGEITELQNGRLGSRVRRCKKHGANNAKINDYPG